MSIFRAARTLKYFKAQIFSSMSPREGKRIYGSYSNTAMHPHKSLQFKEELVLEFLVPVVQDSIGFRQRVFDHSPKVEVPDAAHKTRTKTTI